MSASSNRNRKITGVIHLTPAAVHPLPRESQVEAVPPNSRDSRRFIERSRAHELGYELPLNSREAAAYVGLHPKTVERMARMGEIPAHPVSGVRRKTWKFYPSELDAWLRARVNSRRHLCSPNRKDKNQ
jgi:excisionase family DNA binding protein